MYLFIKIKRRAGGDADSYLKADSVAFDESGHSRKLPLILPCVHTCFTPRSGNAMRDEPITRVCACTHMISSIHTIHARTQKQFRRRTDARGVHRSQS